MPQMGVHTIPEHLLPRYRFLLRDKLTVPACNPPQDY